MQCAIIFLVCLQVEALLVEMLRLQELVGTKHHPFSGMRHQTSIQSAGHAEGHVRTSTSVPYMPRKHAKSQKHVDDMLNNLLMQLSEDEGNDDCDTVDCVEENDGCQRSVNVTQPQQQSLVFNNVYSNAAYANGDERPAQERSAVEHTLHPGSKNGAAVPVGHGTDDGGAGEALAVAEDSNELRKQLEQVELDLAAAVPPQCNGSDSTLLGQRSLEADGSIRRAYA